MMVAKAERSYEDSLWLNEIYNSLQRWLLYPKGKYNGCLAAPLPCILIHGVRPTIISLWESRTAS